MDVFEEFSWRGLIHSFTEGLPELLQREKVSIYNGFDATADSLHVGHLVPLIALARLQRFGHSPIALAGGGTTLIGDPSGKATERQLLAQEQVEANVESIKLQLAHIVDFEVKSNPAKVINNADWLLQLPLVEFLRDVGKHFTVNYMLAKDSVRTRLDREEGISFTEFSYMLLQSYDFLHLYQNANCLLQTGGSDQWGNITAGAELIRRVTGGSAYGMVYPLITKADGTKFGKTESGSVWLSPNRTSPYRFYQFWLNTGDREVIPYLKLFTWLSRAEVEELERSLVEKPEQREAQQRLAHEMTAMIHGETALKKAQQASRALFGEEITGLSGSDIEDIFADVPSTDIKKQVFSGSGFPVVDLLVDTGIAKSRGEARRSIEEGGMYVNNQRVGESDRMISMEDVIDGRFLVLRKGRKNYHLVRVVG